MAVRIRCQYLGLTAAFALALSVSAAADWSAGNTAPANTPVPAQTGIVLHGDEVSPMPAPVLFLAGGLLAVAAMVRWRQRMRSR